MNSKAFDLLIKLFNEKKLAHAFLIETNNFDKTYKMLLKFLKVINCSDKYIDGCEKCNLCHLIDNLSLPSIVVINPDGANIKKEQIIELKNKFVTKPLFSKYNNYLIMHAECLNSSSANTMLKFIEEPEDNIIGFFVTNNKGNVIETIKSRCEILIDYYEEDFFTNIPTMWKDEAIKYIKEFETAKYDTVFYNRDILLPILEDKQCVLFLFKAMFIIYNDLYKSLIYKSDYDDKLEYLNFLLTKGENFFIKRMNLLNKILDDLNYNINVLTLLDRFVLEGSEY